eukprot:gb/GFBE01074245.1/.p1 GENE.gb/GFBE01074245.1/~~gb/GFBE01074245.1/.p1  ORF type:complete len:720 (+),score=156.71 gb/GFBE01074245.1/:1-2160(+)
MGSEHADEECQKTAASQSDDTKEVTITLELAVVRLREYLLQEFQTEDAAIQALDVNGDGRLYFEDVQSAVKRLSIPETNVFGDLNLRKVFRELDVSGCGQLAIAEIFESNLWKAEEQAVLLLRDCLKSRFGKTFAIISALDDDSSELISCSKFDSALAASGIQIHSILGGMSLLRIYDFLGADSSGRLSWTSLLNDDPAKAAEECQACIRQFQEKLLPALASTGELWNKLDAGGSGSISYSDLKSILEQSNVAIQHLVGKKDLRWYFRMLDVQGVGKVSTAELHPENLFAKARKLAESRCRRYLQNNPRDAAADSQRRRGVLPFGPRLLGAGTRLGSTLRKVQEARQQQLEHENEELREQLNAKVWTMALSRVADMERSQYGEESEDHFGVSSRIAALEVAMFGSSASKEDLVKRAAAEHDLQQLREEHGKLLEEHNHAQQLLQNKWHESGSDPAQGDYRKLQEKYHKAQTQLAKLKVDHFRLETQHEDLKAGSSKVLQELRSARDQQTRKFRRLRGEYVRNFEELQRLKALQPKSETRISQLQEENLRLQGELARIRSDPETEQQLRSDCSHLQAELDRAKADYNKLCKKHELLRKQLSEQLNSRAQSEQRQEAPKTMESSCEEIPIPFISEIKAMPQRPAGMERSLSKGDVVRVRAKTSKASLDRPNSAAIVKHRLFEIEGKVRYCDDRWQEWCSGNISKNIKRGSRQLENKQQLVS